MDVEEADEPTTRWRWMEAITPLRALLFVVWLGAGVAAAYGVIVARSLPLTVSGLAVWGVMFFVFGLIAAGASVRAGRSGAAAMAFFAALFGGLCMLGASGAITLAIVLGLLASPT